MAARKLQAEIERTLKKVTEGVEIFEGIFDKINASTNQTQKDKLENDLKSQIKKLQRLRDQIKTWMTSSDIKDKQPLADNRRLIEQQMERFKACEKEMKTKAFSKEGLNATAKLDPKEQLKLELCDWITTMVDELSKQVEQTEAEVETMQLLRKKKNSDGMQRLEELETLNERRNWHVGRLELILRLLENGNLQTDPVVGVKDDIAYFVESNTEEDFEEDEGIYDDLNLKEEEAAFAMGGDDILSSHDSASVADDVASVPPTPVVAPAQIPKTPAKEAPVISTSKPIASASEVVKPIIKAPTSAPARKSTLDSTTPRPVISTPTRSVSGPAPVLPRTTPAPLPPIRYAAAAAAANVPTTPVSTTSVSSISATPIPAPLFTSLPPSLPLASASSPSRPPGITPSAPESRLPSLVSSPEISKSVLVQDMTTQVGASSMAPSPLLASAAGVVQPSPVMSVSSTNGSHLNGSSAPSPFSNLNKNDTASPIGSSPRGVGTPYESPKLASGVAPGAERAVSGEPRLPSSLADLVTSFESAKQKSMRRDNDLSGIHKILEAGFSNVPQPMDAEKPKYYVPRNHHATPGYYPQEPSGQFASANLFSKFDVDTLFYVFYYCQGTYLQYLAAAELKKQSWRFHKQYLTWFQRANEPQSITDEYEQGVYLYFDWEGSWCQRRKSDFRFEYRYLETE